ncbi:MAG: L-lysine 6-transaminase [Candidatus Kapabacteria bacterium]|nr:L-lysine 6-transaminase [Candidatus Kapabacteria bacterium]
MLVESLRYKSKYHVDAIDVKKELKKHMLADGFDFILDLYTSQGSDLRESINGRSFLDMFTCYASMPIGMNHPKMIDPRFLEYIGKVALNKPSNSDIYTSELATFVKTFFEIAVPKHFKYGFFIEGGGLAVENALKAAFDYKIRRNFRKGCTTERGTQILHFNEAFHGRTGYTMSLTNTDPKKVKLFPKFDWARILNPKITFPLNEENYDKVIAAEKISIEAIKKAYRDNPDDIAGIIIEPIQGEGGDNHFRNEFLQQLKDIAHENDSLLIFDEVQTGVGLTGSMWAHEQMGVEPDIMAFGKKMQVCGILVGDKIDEEPENVFKVSSRINSTWGGNLVDMVRATKYLEIIEEEKLVENAKEVGSYLGERLYELKCEFSELLYNDRGRGLFRAIDFTDVAKRDAFVKACFKNQMIILPSGSNAIRFRPALNISRAEIDKGMDIIIKSIKEVI